MNKKLGFKTPAEKHGPSGLRLVYLLLILTLGSLPVLGNTGFPFVVDAAASNPLQYLPASGPASSQLTASVTTTLVPNVSGTYTYAWAQLQDGLNPRAVNASGNGLARITSPTQASSNVSLPIPGVYEFQVTVTDAKNPAFAAVRNVWINIWNNKPEFGSDPLMVAPGCAAPTFVRQLHSDPGPYQHPRVLCSKADYNDMHARVTGGSAVATQAFKDVAASLSDLGLSLPPPTATSKLSTNQQITKDLVSYMGLSGASALSAPYTGTYSGNSLTLAQDIEVTYSNGQASDTYEPYYTLLGNADFWSGSIQPTLRPPCRA